MKKNYFFLSVLAIFVWSLSTKAQLAGTYSVPASYSTIAAAVSALNTQSISGAVTILVDAGHTEVVPVGGLTLTTSGTSAFPIVFQKNGAGANPVLTAYSTGTSTPGSAYQDGVWRFVGTDYITIDGINIVDPNTTNPATMEFGYGFFKASGIDGCQDNTIKNCVITLNRVNNAGGTTPAVDGSRGIDVVNALQGTHNATVAVTSVAGSNSNNKFYSNTIQNCNIGIALIGSAAASPFTFADQSNDIGGISAATGNTIINFGGGAITSPAAGIRTLAQYGINVSYNVINNNTGAGVNHASTLRGIYLNTAVNANATVSNNTLTINSGATTSQVSVIENVSGATGSGNSVSINNNVITNCTNPSATSSTFYGIWNSASSSSLIISNNTFTNNSSNATSGATYLVYNTGAVSSFINLSANQLSHAFTGTVAYSGTMYNVYNNGGTTTTTLNINANSFSNYQHTNITGSGAIYFVYNLTSVSNFNINANNWSGLTMNHSGSEYFMYNGSSTQNLLTVTNNSITAYNRNAASGLMYCYYGASSSPGTGVQTFSANLFSNINAPFSGTGSFYGIYNTDGVSPYPRKSVFNNTLTNINYNSSGAFYGMYTSALGDGSGASGSSVYNNTLDNLSSLGTMYILYNGSTGSPTYPAAVFNNTVSNITSGGLAATVYAGYVFGGGAGTNFYKNKIFNITQNGPTGIAHGIYASTSPTTNIYNNLVGNINTPASSNTTAANGIYIGGGSNINVYYNTVYLNASSTATNFGSSAIYAVTTPTVTLRNNIFVNLSTPTGTGVTAAYRRSSTNLATYSSASNNNLFYSGTPTASNVIFADGANFYQTLGTFISAVAPADANSVTENPPFASLIGSSANFLNLNTGIATQVESAAMPVSGIADDYAGTIRNATTPDIGAWEGNFTPVTSDILAPTFLADGFTTSPCNLSGRTYTLNMTDASGVASGTLSPRIYFNLNGAPYTSNSGTLTSGTALNGVWTFNMAYTANVGDVVSYFVVAQDIAGTPNIGALPGGGFAGTSVNNVTSNPTNPFTYTVNTTLAGTYTVGTAGTFTTLTAAANAYNTACLTGSVTYVLTDAVYSGNETFPVVFLNNPDASTTNSLLVIPAAGLNVTVVTIPQTPTSSTVKFLNARFISFDGLNTNGSSLEISNTHTTTSAALWLASSTGSGPGNKNISLKNMNIVGSGTVATRTGILAGVDAANVTTTSGIDNDFITIQTNTFTNAYTAIYATGTATTVAGGINNWLIDGNTFGPAVSGSNNLSFRGVFVSNAPGISITNNLVRTISGTGSASGVYLSSGINAAIVAQNTITNITSSSASSGVSAINGIYIGSNVINSNIAFNKIHTIENTSASGYSGRGIIINSGAASNNQVHNNMISNIKGTADNTAIYWPIGIALEGTSGGVTVAYNSVSLNSSHAGLLTATASAAMYVNTTGTNNVVVNNILSNTYDNTSISTDVAYAIYSSAANGTNMASMNFNDYYSGGSGNVPVLGYVGSANRLNLASIQTGFGGNQNSINVLPVFTASNDLHLQAIVNNSAIDNAGLAIAGLTLDIDGQVRNATTPDMGADEFSTPNCTVANAGTIPVLMNNLCNGNLLSITSNSVSMGSTSSYQWMSSTTPGGPYVNVTGGSGANTPSYVSPALSTGTLYYVLQVTCAAASMTAVSAEATVAVNPVPTASVSASQTLCAGQTLTLTGASDIGTNFNWNGPAAFISAVQNPSIANVASNASGVYTLIVSTANCSATPVTSTLTVNSTSMSVQAPSSICLGNSATLTAVGNATAYVWNTSATTNSIVVSPVNTTTYSVAGTGTTGCIATSIITVSVNNPTINASPVTACASVITTLSANGFAPVSWYASPSSTVVLGTGNTFTTLAVNTNTFYAQATSNSADSLFTMVNGTSSFMGEMFNVVALNNITVTGFDVHFSTVGTSSLEIWYRPGSFVGFETSNAGWTLAQTTTVTTAGVGQLTTIPSGLSVSIPAGQTYGFYIVSVSGPLVRYSSGTLLNNVITQNQDVQILEGKSGSTYFNVLTSPRAFNGEIKYNKAGCTSPKIPVVLTVNSSPTISISASSNTVCAGNNSTLTASGAITYTWMSGPAASTNVVSPSANSAYTVTGTDANGCVNDTTINITVNALPALNLTSTQTLVCVNGSTLALSGSPAGGVYSGANVSQSVFTPGPVSATFSPAYSYTDAASGCSNSVSVSIVVSNCTGIDSKVSTSGISVYPNPNNGEFVILFNNEEAKIIELSDLTGRIIFSEITSKDKMNVNMNAFANGVYFVKIKGVNSTEIIKVVKQ